MKSMPSRVTSRLYAQTIAARCLMALALVGVVRQTSNAATFVHIQTPGSEYIYNSADGALIQPVADVERWRTGRASFPDTISVEGSNWLVNGVSFEIRGSGFSKYWDSWALGPRTGGAWTISFDAGESSETGYRELLPGEYDAPDPGFCTLALGFNNCSPSLTVRRSQRVDYWRGHRSPADLVGDGKVGTVNLAQRFDEFAPIGRLPTLEQTSHEFTIHEAVYGPNGEVLSFAADFEQFAGSGKSILSGKLRYNSNVPVPEPASLWLLAGSALAAVSRRAGG